MQRFTGVIGIAVLLGLAVLSSTNRRAIRPRTVLTGLGLQFLFAFLVLRLEYGQRVLAIAGYAVTRLLSYSFAGSQFVFGELGLKNSRYGFNFAFQALPTIIFAAALFSILYHYGIMQFIIRIAARIMTRLMGASGVESLDVAASIFVGQTEAPLTIRPYLPTVTQSELMVIMTAGMAHVSGGMMGAYILTGIDARHLLTAVIMTAPGTILLAKMMVPETEQPQARGAVNPSPQQPNNGLAGNPDVGWSAEEKHENLLDAAAKGTTDGLRLALNVAAMLISFLALIALVNGILGGVHNWMAVHGFRWFPASLEAIFGRIFAPVAFIIGVPPRDCLAIGNLLGTRMVLNELVAFTMLGAQRAALDPRSFTIATFALCGFANLGSIGIQIGGIGALAPNRRRDLARLGLRAMLCGTMANLMSAAIAGILL